MLKDQDYTVLEDIPKDLFELRKKQRSNIKSTKENGITAFKFTTGLCNFMICK